MSVSALLLLLVVAAADTPAGLLAKAREAAQDAKYDKAEVLFRKLGKEHPGTPEARVAEEWLAPNALLRTVDLEVNGDPANRIDVFILGDGYSRERKFQKLFDQGAHDTLKYFDQAPVYRRYRKYFNFHSMNIASADDGVDARGKDFDTALGAYESGATQGQVAVDDQLVARFLQQDPRAEGYAVVIVRLGSLGTGGGGIAVVGGAPGNAVIHEWGHAFARLLDEYTSDVGYTGPTPRGYNVSDTDDPEQAPWKHWLDARTKGVGMFPGAAGRSQGAWRGSAMGCAMNSGPSYCLICREAVVAHIYDLVSPLDQATAADLVLEVDAEHPQTVEVIPMQVVGGPELEVRFALRQVQGAHVAGPTSADPFGGSGDDFGSFGGDDGAVEYRGWVHWNRPSRFGKAPDAPLAGDEPRVERARLEDRRTAYRVTLTARDLEPGNYELCCLVVDPTEWVLKPEWLPLLTESRTWQVTVR